MTRIVLILLAVCGLTAADVLTVDPSGTVVVAGAAPTAPAATEVRIGGGRVAASLAFDSYLGGVQQANWSSDATGAFVQWRQAGKGFSIFDDVGVCQVRVSTGQPTDVTAGTVLISSGYIWSGANQLNLKPATDVPIEIVNRQANGGIDLYPNGVVKAASITTSGTTFFTGISSIGPIVATLQTTGAIADPGVGGPGLEIRTPFPISPTHASYINFHRQGYFAAHFGLDVDNILKLGGWSMGAAAYRVMLGDGYANGGPLSLDGALSAGNVVINRTTQAGANEAVRGDDPRLSNARPANGGDAASVQGRVPGSANGLAILDGSGQIPASAIPAQSSSKVLFVQTADSPSTDGNRNYRSIVGPGIGSCTLPVNFFVPGKMLRIRFSIKKVSGGISWYPTIFRIGAVNVASIATDNTVGPFFAELTVTCRSAGASGDFIVNSFAQPYNGTIGFLKSSIAHNLVINTTASNLVDVQMANDSNTYTCGEMFSIESLN